VFEAEVFLEGYEIDRVDRGKKATKRAVAANGRSLDILLFPRFFIHSFFHGSKGKSDST
jgi:hypothetical protein